MVIYKEIKKTGNGFTVFAFYLALFNDYRIKLSGESVVGCSVAITLTYSAVVYL